MTSVAPHAAVSVTSPYECWYRHFLQNRDGPRTLPWHDAYRLSVAERMVVARPIQQFQLGEWARGRGLVRRASSHSVFAADSRFLPALELFIAEEQGHSNILGRFLDREGLRDSAGYGRSSRDSVLPGAPGCDALAPAPVDLYTHPV